jgi:PhnB protein
MKKKSTYSILTPYLAVKDAAKAIEFYKNILGATEVFRLPHPETGVICHVQLSFKGSDIMLAEEHPQYSKSPTTLSGTTVRLCLTVDDVDTIMTRAQKAGAVVTMPVEDQFYGQRSGTIRDPFGHEWMLQHEIEKVDNSQIKSRFTEMVTK